MLNQGNPNLLQEQLSTIVTKLGIIFLQIIEIL